MSDFDDIVLAPRQHVVGGDEAGRSRLVEVAPIDAWRELGECGLPTNRPEPDKKQIPLSILLSRYQLVKVLRAELGKQQVARWLALSVSDGAPEAVRQFFSIFTVEMFSDNVYWKLSPNQERDWGDQSMFWLHLVYYQEPVADSGSITRLEQCARAMVLLIDAIDQCCGHSMEQHCDRIVSIIRKEGLEEYEVEGGLRGSNRPVSFLSRKAPKRKARVVLLSLKKLIGSEWAVLLRRLRGWVFHESESMYFFLSPPWHSLQLLERLILQLFASSKNMEGLNMDDIDTEVVVDNIKSGSPSARFVRSVVFHLVWNGELGQVGHGEHSRKIKQIPDLKGELTPKMLLGCLVHLQKHLPYLAFHWMRCSFGRMKRPMDEGFALECWYNPELHGKIKRLRIMLDMHNVDDDWSMSEVLKRISMSALDCRPKEIDDEEGRLQPQTSRCALVTGSDSAPGFDCFAADRNDGNSHSAVKFMECGVYESSLFVVIEEFEEVNNEIENRMSFTGKSDRWKPSAHASVVIRFIHPADKAMTDRVVFAGSDLLFVLSRFAVQTAFFFSPEKKQAPRVFRYFLHGPDRTRMEIYVGDDKDEFEFTQCTSVRRSSFPPDRTRSLSNSKSSQFMVLAMFMRYPRDSVIDSKLSGLAPLLSCDMYVATACLRSIQHRHGIDDDVRLVNPIFLDFATPQIRRQVLYKLKALDWYSRLLLSSSSTSPANYDVDMLLRLFADDAASMHINIVGERLLLHVQELFSSSFASELVTKPYVWSQTVAQNNAVAAEEEIASIVASNCFAIVLLRFAETISFQSLSRLFVGTEDRNIRFLISGQPDIAFFLSLGPMAGRIKVLDDQVNTHCMQPFDSDHIGSIISRVDDWAGLNGIDELFNIVRTDDFERLAKDAVKQLQKIDDLSKWIRGIADPTSDGPHVKIMVHPDENVADCFVSFFKEIMRKDDEESLNVKRGDETDRSRSTRVHGSLCGDIDCAQPHFHAFLNQLVPMRAALRNDSNLQILVVRNVHLLSEEEVVLVLSRARSCSFSHVLATASSVQVNLLRGTLAHSKKLVGGIGDDEISEIDWDESAFLELRHIPVSDLRQKFGEFNASTSLRRSQRKLHASTSSPFGPPTSPGIKWQHVVVMALHVLCGPDVPFECVPTIAKESLRALLGTTLRNSLSFGDNDALADYCTGSADGMIRIAESFRSWNLYDVIRKELEKCTAHKFFPAALLATACTAMKLRALQDDSIMARTEVSSVAMNLVSFPCFVSCGGAGEMLSQRVRIMMYFHWLGQWALDNESDMDEQLRGVIADSIDRLRRREYKVHNMQGMSLMESACPLLEVPCPMGYRARVVHMNSNESHFEGKLLQLAASGYELDWRFLIGKLREFPFSSTTLLACCALTTHPVKLLATICPTTLDALLRTTGGVKCLKILKKRLEISIVLGDAICGLIGTEVPTSLLVAKFHLCSLMRKLESNHKARAVLCEADVCRLLDNNIKFQVRTDQELLALCRVLFALDAPESLLYNQLDIRQRLMQSRLDYGPLMCSVPRVGFSVCEFLFGPACPQTPMLAQLDPLCQILTAFYTGKDADELLKLSNDAFREKLLYLRHCDVFFSDFAIASLLCVVTNTRQVQLLVKLLWALQELRFPSDGSASDEEGRDFQMKLRHDESPCARRMLELVVSVFGGTLHEKALEIPWRWRTRFALDSLKMMNAKDSSVRVGISHLVDAGGREAAAAAAVGFLWDVHLGAFDERAKEGLRKLLGKMYRDPDSVQGIQLALSAIDDGGNAQHDNVCQEYSNIVDELASTIERYEDQVTFARRVLLDGLQLTARRCLLQHRRRQESCLRWVTLALWCLSPEAGLHVKPRPGEEVVFIKQMAKEFNLHSIVSSAPERACFLAQWLVCKERLPYPVLAMFEKSSDSCARKLQVAQIQKQRENSTPFVTTAVSRVHSKVVLRSMLEEAEVRLQEAVAIGVPRILSVTSIVVLLDRGLDVDILFRNLRMLLILSQKSLEVTCNAGSEQAGEIAATSRVVARNVILGWLECAGFKLAEIQALLAGLLEHDFQDRWNEFSESFLDRPIQFFVPATLDPYLRGSMGALLVPFGSTDDDLMYTAELVGMLQWLTGFSNGCNMADKSMGSKSLWSLLERAIEDLVPELAGKDNSQDHAAYLIFVLKRVAVEHQDKFDVIPLLRGLVRKAMECFKAVEQAEFFRNICWSIGFADTPRRLESKFLESFLLECVEARLVCCYGLLNELVFYAQMQFIELKLPIGGELRKVEGIEFDKEALVGTFKSIRPGNLLYNSARQLPALDFTVEITGARESKVLGGLPNAAFESNSKAAITERRTVASESRSQPFFRSRHVMRESDDEQDIQILNQSHSSFSSLNFTFPEGRCVVVRVPSLLALQDESWGEENFKWSAPSEAGEDEEVVSVRLQSVTVLDGPGGVLAIRKREIAHDVENSELLDVWATCVFLPKASLVDEHPELLPLLSLPSHAVAWKLLSRALPVGGVLLGDGVVLKKTARGFLPIFVGSSIYRQHLLAHHSEMSMARVTFVHLYLLASSIGLGFEPCIMELLRVCCKIYARDLRSQGWLSDEREDLDAEREDFDVEEYLLSTLRQLSRSALENSSFVEHSDHIRGIIVGVVRRFLQGHSSDEEEDEYQELREKLRESSSMIPSGVLLDMISDPNTCHFLAPVEHLIGITPLLCMPRTSSPHVTEEFLKKLLFENDLARIELPVLNGKNGVLLPGCALDDNQRPIAYFDCARPHSMSSGIERIGLVMQVAGKEENLNMHPLGHIGIGLGAWISSVLESSLQQPLKLFFLRTAIAPLTLSDDFLSRIRLSAAPLGNDARIYQTVLSKSFAASLLPIFGADTSVDCDRFQVLHLVRGSFTLPPDVAPMFNRRSGDFGIFIASAHVLLQLRDRLKVPLHIVDVKELHSRGITTAPELYRKIIAAFTEITLIVWVRNMPVIPDSVLKWAAEYTKCHPHRFIWFENSNTNTNLSENRDRCDVSFFLEPTLLEIEKGHAVGNMSVKELSFSAHRQDSLAQQVQNKMHFFERSASHTEILGFWREKLRSFVEQVCSGASENRCCMIFSPPGAGKTKFMKGELPKFIEDHVELVEFDCSSDILVRESLSDVLESRTLASSASKHSMPLVLVCDEYHMLSPPQKRETMMFLQSHEHVHGLLIGNRMELEDQEIASVFNAGVSGREGYEESLAPCRIYHCRLPVIHLVSEAASFSPEHDEHAADLECMLWFWAAARAIFGDEILSYRVNKDVWKHIQQRQVPEALLAQILYRKMPKIGEFMALEVTRCCLSLFKHFYQRFRGEDPIKVARDMVGSRVTNPVDYIVRMALLRTIVDRHCSDRVLMLWSDVAHHGIRDGTSLTHDNGQRDPLEDERDEKVLQSFEEFDRTLPAASTVHPLVRVGAWITYLWRMNCASLGLAEDKCDTSVLQYMSVIDQTGFPLVLSIQSQEVDLSRCKAFSERGDYTDLEWIKCALQRHISIDWHSVKKVWARRHLTDALALRRLIAASPDPREVLSAVTDSNLCTLLRSRFDVAFASTICQHLCKSEYAIMFHHVHNPLMCASWYLFCANEVHSDGYGPSAPYSMAFWLWAAEFSAMYCDALGDTEPDKLEALLARKLLEITNRIVTSRGIRSAVREQLCVLLWSKSFLSLLHDDDVLMTLPHCVLHWISLSPAGLAVNSPEVIRLLGSLYSGQSCAADITRLARKYPDLFCSHDGHTVVPSFTHPPHHFSGDKPCDSRILERIQAPVEPVNIEKRFVQGILESVVSKGEELPHEWQATLLRGTLPFSEQSPSSLLTRSMCTSPKFIARHFSIGFRSLTRASDIWPTLPSEGIVAAYRKSFIRIRGSEEPGNLDRELAEQERRDQQERRTRLLENQMSNIMKAFPYVTTGHSVLLEFYNPWLGDDGFRNCLKQAKTDDFKNPMGSVYDLARDGAYSGLNVLVGNFYHNLVDGVEDPLLSTSRLKEHLKDIKSKGFQFTVVDKENDFCESLALGRFDVAWVVSSAAFEWYQRAGGESEYQLSCARLAHVCQQFHNNGGGLLLYGENWPFYAHANVILGKLFDRNVQLEDTKEGAVFGDNMVIRDDSEHAEHPYSVSKGKMQLDHPLVSGIQTLYEGKTICYPMQWNYWKEHGAVSVASGGFPRGARESSRPIVIAFERPKKGRVIVDMGFTKLWLNWKEGATERLTSNCTAWLMGIDRVVTSAPQIPKTRDDVIRLLRGRRATLSCEPCFPVIECPRENFPNPHDVVVVIDVSGSMEREFSKAMRFALSLCEKLSAERPRGFVRIGLVLFHHKIAFSGPLMPPKEFNDCIHFLLQKGVVFGRTNFVPAVREASRIIQTGRRKHSDCTVFFQTDGENHDTDAWAKEGRRICRDWKRSDVSLEVILVGPDALRCKSFDKVPCTKHMRTNYSDLVSRTDQLLKAN